MKAAVTGTRSQWMLMESNHGTDKMKILIAKKGKK